MRRAAVCYSLLGVSLCVLSLTLRAASVSQHHDADDCGVDRPDGKWTAYSRPIEVGHEEVTDAAHDQPVSCVFPQAPKGVERH